MAVSNEELWKKFNQLFDNKVTVENGLNVRYMRSILRLAAPINNPGGKRYADEDDDDTEQKTKVTDFYLDVRDLSNESSGTSEIRVNNSQLNNVIFRETLQGDVAYAVFSVLFVIFYIWFHLESFFMAGFSMLLIILSFPVSYFIYTGIFQVTMNTTLN